MGGPNEIATFPAPGGSAKTRLEGLDIDFFRGVMLGRPAAVLLDQIRVGAVISAEVFFCMVGTPRAVPKPPGT